MDQQQQMADNDGLRQLKHDIKNQLSQIHLALEQLRYEMPEPSADCLFYLDTIQNSATQINNLLNNTP